MLGHSAAECLIDAIWLINVRVFQFSSSEPVFVVFVVVMLTLPSAFH